MCQRRLLVTIEAGIFVSVTVDECKDATTPHSRRLGGVQLEERRVRRGVQGRADPTLEERSARTRGLHT